MANISDVVISRCYEIVKNSLIASLLLLGSGTVISANASRAVGERMVEWTIESRKSYSDPFNEVDVDVVFAREGKSWRVPAFWRGGMKWTVRFAPPFPGTYDYFLDSTDKNNSDLNGHPGKVTIATYSGPNSVLKHGFLQLSSSRRYFVHADGTPFYWLADTWWTGLSGRLSWDNFKELVADRKAKGFTVVQLAAGLVPIPEEVAPTDPGYSNEGGAVWDKDFKQINPRYFDYADRRIEHLLKSGMVPAIVGGWRPILAQIGNDRMKKHWRYIIARYSAYPVFWVTGGEIFDPPPEIASKLSESPLFAFLRAPGWTDIARYIRATDPYGHPLTAHEIDPPFDSPLQDETLTDFDLFQAGHRGWPSIATGIALLNTHYSRVNVIKPEIIGEIGYERLGAVHLEDFQRVAFWLAMLNGAAGHSYGAVGTWMSYTADKPLHRVRFSFMNWREGMNLPGSYQIGLGAKLLQDYRWWEFAPHPEWITPRGTTLLKPQSRSNGFDIDLIDALARPNPPAEDMLPLGEWNQLKGNFRLPYAAGIPGKVRVIYIPYFGFKANDPPTVLALESGVRYRAYYWDPTLGIKFDLGAVERPTPGAVIREDHFDHTDSAWSNSGESELSRGKLLARQTMMVRLADVSEADVAVSVEAKSRSSAGLILRSQATSYLAAIYSSKESMLYLIERRDGIDGKRLGATPVSSLDSDVRLEAEVRGSTAIASISDGRQSYTTPIVRVEDTYSGTTGILHEDDGAIQEFDNFQLRKSSILAKDDHLRRRLYDSEGIYRGELTSSEVPEGAAFGIPDWNDFGREKHLLLNAYQPGRFPYFRDWILVLETEQARIRLE